MPATDVPAALASDAPAEVRTFDLSKVVSSKQCGSVTGGEIVVCATDVRRNRMQTPAYEFPLPEPPKARLALKGGGSIAVETEQASVGGTPSNRVKVGVKLPF
ncbi:hypothetical protein NVSP9465_01296 [Novosphingobium sp. CECT 9465]|nr:hypothetical protein NVSP9465_01296 [Novosphingobium sp. CECT 9465]